MILTPDNYLSLEADREFLSFHQWQAWLRCPAREKARLEGKIPDEEDTIHFLVGQYVDCRLLTPERFDAWRADHAKEILRKDGTMREPYLQAEEMVKRLQREPVAMRAIEGDHQWICAGVMGGTPWRIMVDAVKPQAEIFVDLKTCRACNEMVWNPNTWSREAWYESYGYWTQVAIYREIIKQNYGKTFLPMILAVSKEEPPDIALLAFEDRDRLEQEIKAIEQLLPDILAMKDGKKEPRACGRCDWCRETKTLKIEVATNAGMIQSDISKW